MGVTAVLDVGWGEKIPENGILFPKSSGMQQPS
ncbi:hypothetical protein Pla144_36360 [Bythopirellula polymerisocia]|uniref:Uncharacterized protein n=1 Tax=Bythopirellula polymerisocia TaxID=2528003 RepID=A0A5C6CJK2_9BACT|nr:hypothetical protein Pla144_36360 [Bythopirellula polymerisocia]